MMAVNIAKPGPRINKNLEEKFGMISSLKNNFNPSASGCNIPKGPALLGPRRSCKMAATFLSAKVVYIAITSEAITTMTISTSFSTIKAASIAKSINLFYKFFYFFSSSFNNPHCVDSPSPFTNSPDFAKSSMVDGRSISLN